MKRSGSIVLVMCLLMAMCVMVPSHDAQAQTDSTPTPTPTITPTPADLYRVPLSSGAELVVVRQVTYGDILIAILLGLLLVGNLVYWTVLLVKRWL